jgi:hypothetical protein
MRIGARIGDYTIRLPGKIASTKAVSCMSLSARGGISKAFLNAMPDKPYKRPYAFSTMRLAEAECS